MPNAKQTLKLFKSAFHNRIYRPKNFFTLMDNISPKRSIISCDKTLLNSINWLCKAQDVTRCGGIAAGYSLRNGWEPAYPETTGYIIETFYDYAKYSGKTEFRHRAKRMAEWLLSIQMPSGAFQGGPVDIKPEPVVFNTGMILFGLVRAWKEESNSDFLTAAEKAGDWLVDVQDVDGAWRKNTYKGGVHTYKTRVAWGLLELWKATEQSKYLEAAKKNLEWALLRQRDNGFFANMAFANESPFTHTIAYTIRGLLESGIILDNQKMISAAIKPADRLFRYFEINQNFPGQFDDQWKANVQYKCVTGCAQFSIIWQKIYQALGDARYLNAALKMNDWLITSQVGKGVCRELDGAIPGSVPLWGNYMPYYYPNWATKFYCDAVLFQTDNLKQLKITI